MYAYYYIHFTNMHTLQYEFKLDYLSIRIPLPGIEKHVYIVC